jgi:hypothetical protein
MILVVLPLGTFRMLHALLRPKAAISCVVATDFPTCNGSRQFGLTCAICQSRPGLPDGKMQFRSWADVTFLQSESPELCGAWVDSVPLGILEDPQVPNAPTFEVVSSLQAHRTPREAIIAACTLLI